MNNKPKVAKVGNYAVEVEEGKTYYWCQCGRDDSLKKFQSIV